MEKILIVDDSILQAAQLKAILEDEYDITIAQTAEDGLGLVNSADFSLILLDVVMPGMDGFTLLKKLQEEIITQSIPVILITSLVDVAHEQRGLVLGAVDYIAKPFSPMIVKARVNTHIKLYHYRRQAEQQSMIDQLTGIANRRRYEQYSAEKWNEAIRLHVPFSICMFDIDRSMDFLARYGGEEFVALTMGDPSEKLFPHLVKIRQEIENLRIPHDPSVSQWVTVSIGGVTVIPKMGDAYDFYLKIADTMLYDAKKQGRNRVIWADERMRLMGEPSHALSVHETGGNV